MNLTEEEKQIFCEVADTKKDGVFEIPEGAYNFRVNGKAVSRNSTDNINIKTKKSNSGLEIHVKENTKNEQVHIPVAISTAGIKETVYNDFYIGENAEITIIAGCGIYNCGPTDSVHDGIHRFFVGKNAKITYIEKHYGFGQGRGGKILNPTTELHLDKGSEAELIMEQIKGVDSTIRKTTATLEKNAKLIVKERLMTHGRQTAESIYCVELNGEDSTTTIASRSVAQDLSKQTFRSKIIGNNKCRGHSECDAIIMDEAKVSAIPSLDANCVDAELIHEAAIGKIAGEQIIKLMTLGLTRQEAESRVINGFLR